MIISEKIKDAEKFLDQGHLKDALSVVVKIEDSSNLSYGDGLRCKLLKSKILISMGSFKKALNFANQVIYESTENAKQILVVDASISKARALWRLDRYVESLKILDKVSNELNKITDVPQSLLAKKSALIMYVKSSIFWLKGELDQALDYAQDSLVQREKFGNKKDVGWSLYRIGNIYADKGELDLALGHFQKCLAIFKEIGNKQGIGWTNNQLAKIYCTKGEFNRSLKLHQIALEIVEEIGDILCTAWAFNSLSTLYQLKGEFDLAIECAQKSLNLSDKVGSKFLIAWSLSVFGRIYSKKGELNLALEHYQKSLVIFEEIESTQNIAQSLDRIGEIYHSKGEFKAALQYYKKSIAIYKKTKDYIFFSDNIFMGREVSLYHLVKVNIDTDNLDEAERYVQKLENINKKEDNRRIHQIYRIASAMLLKTSKRTIKKADAQRIFQQIAGEKIINYELTVDAMLNLCELLLDELQISGSEEVITEVKEWSNRLLEIAKTQHSYVLLVETYLLQSKLALLELDLQKAQELLDQALLLSKEKNLGKLSMILTIEQESIQKQLSKWEQILDQQPSINEILELTQLETLIERMINKKLYQREEEIFQYAEEAKRLLTTWKKR